MLQFVAYLAKVPRLGMMMEGLCQETSSQPRLSTAIKRMFGGPAIEGTGSRGRRAKRQGSIICKRLVSLQHIFYMFQPKAGYLLSMSAQVWEQKSGLWHRFIWSFQLQNVSETDWRCGKMALKTLCFVVWCLKVAPQGGSKHSTQSFAVCLFKVDKLTLETFVSLFTRMMVQDTSCDVLLTTFT